MFLGISRHIAGEVTGKRLAVVFVAERHVYKRLRVNDVIPSCHIDCKINQSLFISDNMGHKISK